MRSPINIAQVGSFVVDRHKALPLVPLVFEYLMLIHHQHKNSNTRNGEINEHTKKFWQIKLKVCALVFMCERPLGYADIMISSRVQ